MVTIEDLSFELYISEEKIKGKVEELARKIDQHYADKDLSLFVVLNGAFVFAADLIRHLTLAFNTHFIIYKSYQGEERGEIQVVQNADTTSIKGKNILLIEDIVDTGQTLDKIIKDLNKHEPISIETASLLIKPECYDFKHPIKFAGFNIENKFVVGYGMDYNDKGRNLKSIYKKIE